MKVRVAEALALGVPVVGTREGLLGYDAVGASAREVGDIASMTEPIAEIMTNPALGTELAADARRAWETHYSFAAF